MSKEHFFYIDSFNVERIKSKLYGYIITDDSILTDYKNDVSSLEGSFIKVDVTGKDENQIEITQDYLGSMGIYLFENNGYFAISNSLLYLAKKIQKKYTLTINIPYAVCFAEADLCSYSVYDTIFNEIHLIDRWAKIIIDKNEKKMSIELINHFEQSIPLETKEGIDTIDQWHNKWVKRIYALQKQTNIHADLSGGFDSRMVFTLFLDDNIDLNKINFKSLNNNIHCHSEDFKIASMIASQYDFKLNSNSNLVFDQTYTFDDKYQIYSYSKIFEHKISTLSEHSCSDTLYKFSGEGGECIRGYNRMTYNEFLKKQLKKLQSYSTSQRCVLEPIIKQFFNKQHDQIIQKYASLQKTIDENDYGHIHYIESRARHHYGKAIAERYNNNIITLTPCFDPLINKIQSDSFKLPALLYCRFCPEIASMNFEGGRELSKEIMDQVQKLNKLYPYAFFDNDFHDFYLPFKQTCKVIVHKQFDLTPMKSMWPNMIKGHFSKEIKSLFNTYLSEEEYNHIINQLHASVDFPEQYVNTVIAIAYATKICLDSKNSLDGNTEDDESNVVQILKNVEQIAKFDLNIAIDSLRSCPHNDPYIKYQLAKLLSQRSYDCDTGKIFDLFYDAYNNGISDSLYHLFDYLYKKKDTYSAIQLQIVVNELTDDCSIDGFVRLARAYRFGKGVSKNLLKSIDLYRSAAKINENWVKFELFDALLEYNTSESNKEAVHLMQKYAAKGDKNAQLKLNLCSNR